MINKFVCFLAALFITVVLMYIASLLLGEWLYVLVFLLFLGPDGFFWGVAILIVTGGFIFACVFGLLGGWRKTQNQRREAIMCQQRQTDIQSSEPPTTNLYDFQLLGSSYSMLQCLDYTPYQHICRNIEQLLRQKMADSRLLDIAATSMPQWQTVEVLEEENGQTVAVSRTGMAFEFVLHVSGNGQIHQLTGVYTWSGSRLNRPPAEQRQRIWLDLNGTLADFGGSRMAERLKAAN